MSKLPDIHKDFSDWYNEVIHQAELADHGPVRGSMVIRPYGYAIWEGIKDTLDAKIKKTGHQNTAFPLLIPESFLKKEAKHVEGFSPELAVVTHAGGKKLDESLVIRPTSETVVHHMFAKWLNSWRDLPIKINQWANVVRWELRPRLFLRTTEIFWQEGHTAHATKKEAEQEAELMMREYVDLAQNYLAIPVISGLKTEAEKFPGAEKTITFEAVMPDGKALQMGTSHLLHQDFAKAFDMTFQDKEGKKQHPHLTSWGVTTRLVGATVMMHGDEKGLVLPPKIAPIQVVIIPILKKNADNASVLDKARTIAQTLKQKDIRVFVDDDENKSVGNKFFKWEMRGVPLRLELGPRDIESNTVVLADRLGIEKVPVTIPDLENLVPQKLVMLQDEMFKRAQTKVKNLWHKEAKLKDFGPIMAKDGGLYQTGWCQDPACEQELKKFKAFTRCLLPEKTFEFCFWCDKPSITDVLVAKAY